MSQHAAAGQKLGGTAAVYDAEWNELDRGPIDEVMNRLTQEHGKSKYLYATLTTPPGTPPVNYSGRGA